MDTAVINIRIEPEVKNKAQKVAEKFGFSLSSLIKGYLRHLIRTKRVEFSLKEEPSTYMARALQESVKDTKAGRVSPTFDNAEDAIAWLNNPKKKYAGKVR